MWTISKLLSPRMATRFRVSVWHVGGVRAKTFLRRLMRSLRPCVVSLIPLFLFPGCHNGQRRPNLLVGTVRLPPQPDAVAILKEASAVALSHAPRQIWTESVLRPIVKAQLLAGDIDGACASASGMVGVARTWALCHIAESWAQNGEKQRGLAMLDELGPEEPGCRDGVLLRFAEYHLGNEDFGAADLVLTEIASGEVRVRGLSSKAVAFVQCGRRAAAEHAFQQALAAVATLDGNAELLCEIARAQTRCGFRDGALLTIRQVLASTDQSQDLKAKVGGYREAGVLLAGLGRSEEANRAFSAALRAAEQCSSLGLQEVLLRSIALGQAQTGRLLQARHTTAAMPSSSASRDATLLAIIERILDRGDFQGAMEARKQMTGSVLRAAALLSVAARYAEAGNRTAAVGIAQRVKLSHPNSGVAFHYREPETWGVVYRLPLDSGFGDSEAAMEDAATLAGAAMRLHQTLGAGFSHPPIDFFSNFPPVVLRSMAYSQSLETAGATIAGDWAREMPTDRQRTFALLGLAEGMLAEQAQMAEQGSLSHRPAIPWWIGR